MADYLKATAKVPQSFSFNGFRIRPGEHFTSESPAMTRTLLAIGFAEREECFDADKFAAVLLQTGEITQETTVDAPRKRGRPKGYKRRDVRAEG